MFMKREVVYRSYKNFLQRNGYNIIFDGCDPANDTEVFFVLYSQNPDNSKEPNYTFFQIFTDAPLSLLGYEQTVMIEQKPDEFLKMIEARVKGCTINKSAVLYCLLGMKFAIDDIYINGNIKLSPNSLKEISRWVNFKGALDAKPRPTTKETSSTNR